MCLTVYAVSRFCFFTENRTIYTETLCTAFRQYGTISDFTDIKTFTRFVKQNPETIVVLEGTGFGTALYQAVERQTLLWVCESVLCLRLKAIHSLFKPAGMWHIVDIRPDSFPIFLKTSLNAPPFLSPRILFFLEKANLPLRDFDLKLLHCLNQGIPAKNLPDCLPGAASTIERAKRKLKTLFKVEQLTDCALVNRAREWGFLSEWTEKSNKYDGYPSQK